jgi:hypothetical protein
MPFQHNEQPQHNFLSDNLATICSALQIQGTQSAQIILNQNLQEMQQFLTWTVGNPCGATRPRREAHPRHPHWTSARAPRTETTATRVADGQLGAARREEKKAAGGLGGARRAREIGAGGGGRGGWRRSWGPVERTGDLLAPAERVDTAERSRRDRRVKRTRTIQLRTNWLLHLILYIRY